LGLLQQWYSACAVAVKIALGDDLSEIRHSVGEFDHDSHPFILQTGIIPCVLWFKSIFTVNQDHQLS